MREIRTLRAMWRELETELRNLLNGHAGGKTPDTASECPRSHRASSRPYRQSAPDFELSSWAALMVRRDIVGWNLSLRMS